MWATSSTRFLLRFSSLHCLNPLCNMSLCLYTGLELQKQKSPAAWNATIYSFKQANFGIIQSSLYRICIWYVLMLSPSPRCVFCECVGLGGQAVSALPGKAGSKPRLSRHDISTYMHITYTHDTTCKNIQKRRTIVSQILVCILCILVHAFV